MWGREFRRERKDKEREGGEKERKKKEEKGREREREREEKRERKKIGFVWVFKIRFYTSFDFFGIKFRFYVFLIMFTIFNKYGTKLNFQVNTLNQRT